MTWTTKLKELSTTATVGYTNVDPNVVGRAPSQATIRLSPLELYGAAARCSHMHLVDPAIATPESDMIAKLIEPHVDNVSDEFAILDSADSFKDYVKSYFVGTVATGLAYLAMINEGYVWADHFENAGGGNLTYTRKPDFAFGGVGLGVAIMESKGSRSGTLSAFDATVADGYTGQVEPHLGHLVGGATASHGYCIGSWLKSPTQAELRVHHTRTAPSHLSANGTATPSLATIQRHNFATAFTLAHSSQLGIDLRRGQSSDPEIMFLRIEWLGRHWLTGFEAIFGTEPFGWPFDLWRLRHLLPQGRSTRPPFLIFAVEERIAKVVLTSFLGRPDVLPSDVPDLGPLDEDTRTAARAYGADGRGGIAFPDGLAILDWRKLQLKFKTVVWNPDSATFIEV